MPPTLSHYHSKQWSCEFDLNSNQQFLTGKWWYTFTYQCTILFTYWNLIFVKIWDSFLQPAHRSTHFALCCTIFNRFLTHIWGLKWLPRQFAVCLGGLNPKLLSLSYLQAFKLHLSKNFMENCCADNNLKFY